MQDPSGRQPSAERGAGAWARLLILALSLFAPAVTADQLIPSGGTLLLDSGEIDLACTNLLVNGVLDTGTGTYVNVLSLTVGPSGVIQGTGSINYSGTLAVSGTVQPSVRLVVNLPSNAACPGPGPGPARLEQIPTLDISMQVALATLLLLLAGWAIRAQRVPRRRSEPKGANK